MGADECRLLDNACIATATTTAVWLHIALRRICEGLIIHSISCACASVQNTLTEIGHTKCMWTVQFCSLCEAMSSVQNLLRRSFVCCTASFWSCAERRLSASTCGSRRMNLRSFPVGAWSNCRLLSTGIGYWGSVTRFSKCKCHGRVCTSCGRRSVQKSIIKAQAYM